MRMILLFVFFCFFISASQMLNGQSPAGGLSNPPVGSPPPASASPSVSTVGNDMVSKILAAGIGGFLGWVMIKCVGWCVLRSRFNAYLLVVINSHLKQYQEHQRWLQAVREKTIKEGHIVKLAAGYTVDELKDLTEIRQDALVLLRESEILRITKLIRRLEELEALLAGFCATLETHKVGGKPLANSDAQFLRLKQDRILSYMAILPKEIDSLHKLPLDYSGIIDSGVLVTEDSAVLPTPAEQKPPAK